MRGRLLFVLLCMPCLAWAQATPDAPVDYNVVVLQGLNKVTGHISRFEGPVGASLRFGTLEIIARHCWKAPPEDQPENAALLDISELKPDEGAVGIFLGWMFSSSPGLSGLEHAVYDITVLSCEARSDPEHVDAPQTKDTDKSNNAKVK